MKKYKAVIFDMDGTILDTLGDLTSAVNVMLTHFGYPECMPDKVRQSTGNGVIKLMDGVIPGGEDNPRFREMTEYYVEYYSAHALDRTAPYEGISPLFYELKKNGIKCAVVSNKMHRAVVELTKIFFPDADYSCGEREEDGIRRKPFPDMVFDCLRAVGVSPEDAVYVGDSEVDVATAKNSGLDCISVLWGFRDENELRECGARTFAKTTKELSDLLIG
ncbi:MAG: HAD family hydrolase [Clostridia bacterium]|nr:HAD family hydrolase [Clostridia bacterium]